MNIFEQAIDLHTRWKRSLKNNIANKLTIDVSEIGNCHACELGAWIYGVGLKYNNLASFEAMCSTHEQFHRAAAEVAMHGNAGDTARAMALLGPGGVFAQTSLRLVALLRQCSAELDLTEEQPCPVVTVGDILDAKVDKRLYSIDASTCIRDALRTMVTDQIGLLVVYKARQFVGVFTERGFVQHVADQGASALDQPIEAAIDHKLISVNRETPLDYCMELMFATHRGHAVVLGVDNVEGVIALADIINELTTNKTYPYRLDRDLRSVAIPGFGNGHPGLESKRVGDISH